MTRISTAALLALGLATSAHAFDITDMTESERSAFRAEVRAYLMDNPEVLMEAIGVLEERQAKQQAASDETLVQTNANALFEDGYSWVGGNLDGDITMVEFVDYKCGYCRKAHDEVAKLVNADGNIKFILKEFPILGQESVLSSRFAIATKQLAGDDTYKKVHDKLITFRGTINDENLRRLAESFDLDADAVMAQMAAPEVDTVLAENRALAQRMNISGTPTFVLGPKMLRGYVPLDGMRQIVAGVRAE